MEPVGASSGRETGAGCTGGGGRAGDGALSGWMWDGRRGRALPSGAVQPGVDEGAPAPVWPVAKIGGRFLAPFLHGLVADGRLAPGPVGVPA